MANLADSVCVCCKEPIVGGWHACKCCKAAVHGAILCDKKWMPQEGDYFCSQQCIEKHNSDAVSDAHKMPLRRRPDEEDVEPADAATWANAADAPAPKSKRKAAVQQTAGAGCDAPAAC